MKMSNKILLTPFAAIGFACASAPPPPPPAPVAPVAPKAEVRKSDPMEAANDSFAKGDYEVALKDYTAILQSNPKSDAAGFNRAVTLQKLGKLDEARAAYETFLADHPNHVDAVLNLGGVLRTQGDSQAAIALYNKALKSDPYNSRILNNLVVLYRDKKDYKAATQAVRTLLMRDQKNIDAYKNLALVYYDQQKYKLTQTILANALRMAKEQKIEDPDIHVNFGLTHLALGDKGKAMASFKKAVEIDPNHLLGNYNIGALALAHRDYNLATKAFAICAKAWPSDPEVIASYGFALQGQQKYPEAAAELEKAKKLKPESAQPVVYQLMVVWQAAEKPEKALEYGNELLKITGKTCKPDDYEDPICGRINGINVMIQMKNKPPEPEEKPKATGKGESLFTDAPAEGDEAAPPPPAEGAEGQEAPPPDAPK
jgi:tetratricopeptide (TPR) repeat protein